MFPKPPLPLLDPATGMKEKHLAMFAILPLVPTWGTRTENLFTAMPPSASCLFFFFCHDFSTKDPKCKSPLSPFFMLQLYKVMGESDACVSACVCAWSSLCTHSLSVVCVCRGVWSTENVRWGGLDVVFQSEWPAEENNKARMTGTDGPLYCPLKCKH